MKQALLILGALAILVIVLTLMKNWNTYTIIGIIMVAIVSAVLLIDSIGKAKGGVKKDTLPDTKYTYGSP